MEEEGKYKAFRKMAIMGQVYQPGETSDLEGIDRAYLAYLLGREFWGVMDGLASLDDELFLMVLEERD
jgi:hypothetical protein